jgi:hypothetical protein
MEDAVFLSIQPVSSHYWTEDTEFQVLSAYNLEAHDRTVADPRFVALEEAAHTCAAGRGFPVARNRSLEGDDYLPGAEVDSDSWGMGEDWLKAALAQATCSDDLGYTQQVADLEAMYQQQLIDAHEAELTTIRAEVDRRVAAAEVILREVGLM